MCSRFQILDPGPGQIKGNKTLHAIVHQRETKIFHWNTTHFQQSCFFRLNWVSQYGFTMWSEELFPHGSELLSDELTGPHKAIKLQITC